MSNDKKPKKLEGSSGNVLELPKQCPVCTGKVKRAGFCDEHFLWFKAGLVNRAGEKPKDFDKKFQSFARKSAA